MCQNCEVYLWLRLIQMSHWKKTRESSGKTVGEGFDQFHPKDPQIQRQQNEQYDMLTYHPKLGTMPYVVIEQTVRKEIFSKTCKIPELLSRVDYIHTHPVSIDKRYFHEKAQLLKYQRNSEKNPNTFIFLGIDRLDPIKGLVEKVQGFESFLENNPAAHGTVQLKQFVIPSREDCEIYRRYKDQLFQLIEIVNKRFGNPYWQPIDVYYYQMDENIIIQSYLSSHALFVSSLADGMNLVAYEYIACQLDSNPGVLCLSKQAGAAQYLESALQFDPTSHIEIQHCFQAAMSLSLNDRQHRQRQSLKYIEHYTVDKWRQALISSCEVPSAQSSLR